MLVWIATAFYVVGPVIAIDAVMTARTAQGAIAWSVALVGFPFLAVPAYLVFGRSKFNGRVDAYHERRAEIDALVATARQNLAPWVVDAGNPGTTYEAIRRMCGMDLVRGNRVELLVDGHATFDSIIGGIARATSYVLVQSYMFHDDGLGRRMQQALIERARAGVRVYMLYDEVGSTGLPRRYLRELDQAGVEVSPFRPTQGFRNRFQLNFRNHRKIVVVDGTIGWVGGHNVGDEYLGLHPKLSPWRDTHVRLEGPVVLQLQIVMLSDWYWATRDLPDVRWEPHQADGDPDSDRLAMIVPSAPSQRLETAGLMFVAALHSATHRIWLTAPYFVPDEAVLKALELAALRGVDVRILLPSRCDSLPVFLAGFHYVDLLRGLGIRFYTYEPGILHQKVMLVDDEVSAVGTANFDNRSFRLNFEVTALIADRSFADEVAAMLEHDFAHAAPLDHEELDAKPFWWRLGVSLSRLASPVL